MARIENGSEGVIHAGLEEKKPGLDNTCPEGPGNILNEGKLRSEHDSRKENTRDGEEPSLISAQHLPLSRLFINHLKAVSLKGQVRLSSKMKHSICRRCDILLVPGFTSTSNLENKSRKGKKPWADVLVVTCTSCGAVKRFPVGAKRQFGRPDRARQEKLVAS